MKLMRYSRRHERAALARLGVLLDKDLVADLRAEDTDWNRFLLNRPKAAFNSRATSPTSSATAHSSMPAALSSRVKFFSSASARAATDAPPSSPTNSPRRLTIGFTSSAPKPKLKLRRSSAGFTARWVAPNSAASQKVLAR